MSCLTATCFCGKPDCRTAQPAPVSGPPTLVMRGVNGGYPWPGKFHFAGDPAKWGVIVVDQVKDEGK